MMGLTLTLIEDPPFRLDLGRFSKRTALMVSSVERVKQVVEATFQLIALIGRSAGKAAYMTVSYGAESFKYHALRHYGSLQAFSFTAERVYLLAFRLVIWVAGMGYCFLSTTARLVLEKNQSSRNELLLSNYAYPEIDTSHIRTNQVSIDVSHVPDTVKVDDLIEMLEEINFDDPNAPGYMAPSARQRLTKPTLQASLRTFVDYVKERKAFLGTPPQHDIPRLFAFYDQIEKSVRFCIHKTNEDLAAFRRDKGTDVAAYHEADLQQYKNLLETRALAPLNLAIAGTACGARFMGESMALYDLFSGGAVLKGEIRDQLIEIFALKRKEIAVRHIQQYFGTDPHAYGKYMGSLGSILGIPGTENVIEHLASSLDRPLFLSRFFNEYTVDCILQAIQEKVKTSQPFREALTDWIRDQMPEEWGQKSVDLPSLRRAFEGVQNQRDLDPAFPLYRAFIALEEGIRVAHAQGLSLREGTESEMLATLFKSPVWKSLHPAMQNRGILQSHIQTLFSKESLGADLVEKIKRAFRGENVLGLGDFFVRLLLLQKADAFCFVLQSQFETSIPKETLIRVFKGEMSMEEAFFDASLRERRGEFLSSLHLEEIGAQGFSPIMLEWVTVAHQILLPQQGR